MMTRRRKQHSPEQIVKKLRDAEVMLSTGQGLMRQRTATTTRSWNRASGR